MTMMELLVVIIIIGILAGIGYPSYIKAKEANVDKEAMIALKLIQSAEKIYYMERNAYAICADVVAINDELKLDLLGQNWTYKTQTIAPDYRAVAKRAVTGREWHILLNTNQAEACCCCCIGGTGDECTSGCPACP